MKPFSVKRSTFAALMILVMGVFTTATVFAESAQVIDIKVNETLDKFYKEVGGARNFIASSKGALVFPSIKKAGFIFGGAYGEGALRVGGKSVDYYNSVAGSWGFQAGVQAYSVVIVFMEQGALDKFRASSGWEAGVDGSIALINVGAGGSIDTTNIKDPIVAFVFGQKGLMAGVSLEGSKYTKLNK